MKQVKLEGIPYLVNEKLQLFKSLKPVEQINISVFDFIEQFAYKPTLVRIQGFFTWLHDIRFNYRDKVVEIPYYSYDEFFTDKIPTKEIYRNHLDIRPDGLYIKYNFKKQVINFDLKTSLTIIDVEAEKVYLVCFTSWFDKNLEINELYQRWLNSSFLDPENSDVNHLGGYHYISYSTSQLRNNEKFQRKEYDLPEYHSESIQLEDYRDTRLYKKDYLDLEGIKYEYTENYTYRRLRFESMLYCLLRQGKISFDSSNRIYKVEYKGIPLIFKSYWLNNSSYKPGRIPTYAKEKCSYDR